MSNVIQIRDPQGNAVYPITDASLVIGLQDGPFSEYILSWDGSSTPVVANIPAGVSVVYDSTTYTGTLAASSSTACKVYLVASTSQVGEYDRYITSHTSSVYSWTSLASTQIQSPVVVDNLTTNDPTKALSAKQGKVLNEEVSQLGQKENIDAGLLNLQHLVDVGALNFENGGIKNSGGNNANAQTIRTETPFATSISILAVPVGYVIERITYYSAWTDAENFTLGTGQLNGARFILVDNTYPLARIAVQKSPLENLNAEDFLAKLYLITPKIDVLNKSIFGDLSFSKNGYIDAENGVFVPSSYWFSTDFIPISSGNKILLKSYAVSTVNAAFYDRNRNFLSAVTGADNTSVPIEITAPDEACYFRSSNKNTFSTPEIKPEYIVYEGVVKALNKTPDSKLFDSVNKPIVFNGKSLVAFGDSITKGVSSPNLVNAGENKYISLFCTHTGALLTNNAKSGACITDGMNEIESIHTTITSFTGTADIIIIAGGVNDWQTQATIGTLSDNTPTTFYGALNAICSYLKTNYPDAVVIFVTPIPTTSLTTFGTTHPDNLNDYRKAIQEIAAINGFNVVNGNDLGLPNTMSDYGNQMYAPSDCVHPTLLGHALYARSLAGKLI